jgi:WD40 repeat protein
MYRATLTLPLPTGERYGYGAVVWAADGRRFAVTNTNAFWLWDAVAMKLIRTVKYPSFVEQNTDLTELAWSPDQRFIAALIGGSAQVYEIAAGKWVSHWIAAGDPSPPQSIAWSTDSQHVATTFSNGTVENNGNRVEIHDAITSKLVRSFTFAPSSTDQGNREYISVSWSPDNRWLAAGGQIQKPYNVDQVFATIWDVSSGAQVFSTSYIPGSTSTDNFQLYVTVAWSPDGKRLAVASDTTGVKLWDVSSKKLLRTYSGSGGTFGTGLTWSPDGRYIAASEGSVVRIWDTTSGQTLFSYRGHQQDTIRGLSWSSRGNAIASSSLGSIRVWQPEV